MTILDADFSADADNESDISNEHLYTGRRLDPETGLQLNRNRFYASHLGRWVNRDPDDYYGSKWNLYEYLQSFVIGYVDSQGLFPIADAAVTGPQTSKQPIDHFTICSHLERGRDKEKFKKYLEYLDEKFDTDRHDNAIDLVNQLRNKIKPGQCIQTLEIYGHGNPRSCGQVTASDKEDFRKPAPDRSVRHFHKIKSRFCDDCVIYLDGCNTGLGGDSGLAQEIANITGCKVEGTRGYTSGTKCNEDAKCKKRYSEDPENYPEYPGSIDGIGDECWKGFCPK